MSLFFCRRWNLPGHFPGLQPHGLQRPGQAEPLSAVRPPTTLTQEKLRPLARRDTLYSTVEKKRCPLTLRDLYNSLLVSPQLDSLHHISRGRSSLSSSIWLKQPSLTTQALRPSEGELLRWVNAFFYFLLFQTKRLFLEQVNGTLVNPLEGFTKITR